MLILERAELDPGMGQKATHLELNQPHGNEAWGMVVKGVNDMVMGKTTGQQEVQAEMSWNETCQHRVDAKAFTGRGAARRLREARETVDNIHAEMRQLAATTNGVPGKTFYLCVHRRNATDQCSLRWRATGASAAHLTWAEMEPLFAQYPYEAAQWYREANATALELNAREIAARAALRDAKTYAEIESNLYPTLRHSSGQA